MHILGLRKGVSWMSAAESPAAGGTPARADAGVEPVHHDGDLADLVERARALVGVGRRRLLGITGAPGSGKGTLAGKLQEEIGDSAVLVPMDGFHLAEAQLHRLGKKDRKGAPDTFDAAGYLALLRRLRDLSDEVVYAPEFHREVEESFAGAIAVPPEVPLVITEGNYLLLDSGPWSQVRDLLDEVWFLAPDEDSRLDRLIARHVRYGKSPEQAREWVRRSDEPNAALVSATRARADVLVHGDPA
ncbi:pantothenate kinase [Halopolyspora algeriensis]|uniref:Pantothenate kinase n=1 Tax=Halopolyspora algeriensis TaxID=1500506 RepID=A0A368VEZ5_9ACTN|nr:pantothenate kinase [Halopolyspora algeriensis]TQM56521.1 pantothenate kinase [Halopolyspora algeriensis]